MASDSRAPQLLSDRYRIVGHLDSGAGRRMEAWRGHDSRLDRAVTIWLVCPSPSTDASRDTSDDPAKPDLALNNEELEARVLAHLRQAVKVEDPGLTRIYDTLGPALVGIVSEPIAGDTLHAQIETRGPMSLDRATSLTIELAKTIDTVHRHGVTHGALDANSVGFTSDGRLVIADLGTFGQPENDTEAVSRDIRALAALLHQLTCGRPPHEHGGSVEIDPSTPAPIAGLLTSALGPTPPWATAQQFADALDERHETEADESAGFVSAERRWLVPAAGVLVVAVLLGTIGALVGQTSVGQDLFHNARDAVGFEPTPITTTTSTTATTTAITDAPEAPIQAEASEAAILRITDFDPVGDNREHPERLVLINDLDPSRGWQTEMYTTRDFGRLKEGVGLVIELESPTLLTEVVVRSPTRGWAFELFTAESSPIAVNDWGDPVHTATDIGSDTAVEIDGLEATSVLLWITDLGDGPQFRVTITDIEIAGIGGS